MILLEKLWLREIGEIEEEKQTDIPETEENADPYANLHHTVESHPLTILPLLQHLFL